MKAGELMIGDWVRIGENDKYSGCIGRIMSLQFHQIDDGAYFYVFTRGEKGIVTTEVFNEDIEPIPLTPEILEKNGFTIGKGPMFDGDKYPTFIYVCRKGLKETFISISFYNEPINGVRILTKVSKESYHECGVNSIHSCDIEYVHQLQHALRLCGIEKTIEL